MYSALSHSQIHEKYHHTTILLSSRSAPPVPLYSNMPNKQPPVKLNERGLPVTWFEPHRYQRTLRIFTDDQGNDQHPKYADEMIAAYIYHQNAKLLPEVWSEELLRRLEWMLEREQSEKVWTRTLRIYCQHVQRVSDPPLKLSLAESICASRIYNKLDQYKHFKPLCGRKEFAPILVSLLLDALKQPRPTHDIRELSRIIPRLDD